MIGEKNKGGRERERERERENKNFRLGPIQRNSFTNAQIKAGRAQVYQKKKSRQGPRQDRTIYFITETPFSKGISKSDFDSRNQIEGE